MRIKEARKKQEVDLNDIDPFDLVMDTIAFTGREGMKLDPKTGKSSPRNYRGLYDYDEVGTTKDDNILIKVKDKERIDRGIEFAKKYDIEYKKSYRPETNEWVLILDPWTVDIEKLYPDRDQFITTGLYKKGGERKKNIEEDVEDITYYDVAGDEETFTKEDIYDALKYSYEPEKFKDLDLAEVRGAFSTYFDIPYIGHDKLFKEVLDEIQGNLEEAYNKFEKETDKDYIKSSIDEMERYLRMWDSKSPKEKREIGTKQNLQRDLKYAKQRLSQLTEDVDINVENEGILEVPKDKKVNELPTSHFEKLIDKKGYEPIIRALNNLQVWNKNNNKSLSNWAESMMKKLKDKYRKDECTHPIKEDIEETPNEEIINPTPENIDDEGLTSLLNSLIKDEYDTIDAYNSTILAAKDLGRNDIVDILTTIAHDENTHVGNLLVATKLINPQTQAIDKGEQQALNTLEGDVEIKE